MNMIFISMQTEILITQIFTSHWGDEVRYHHTKEEHLYGCISKDKESRKKRIKIFNYIAGFFN